MKVPKSCAVACVTTLRRVGAEAMIKAIDEEYRVHWIADNLPVGMKNKNDGSFSRGFPIGFKEMNGVDAKRYIYNHLRIILEYHDAIDQEVTDLDANKAVPPAKIVGFRVEPMSIHHSWRGGGGFVKGVTTLDTCSAENPPVNDRKNFQEVKRGETIVFSYDVHWEESEVEWSSRWDTYILASTTDDKVHWFSITNSIMIVLFLTVMIAMILLRALRKDIATYNEIASSDEAREESGWKMVHGDVFRPPSTSPMLLSVFVGTGVQLMCMSVATLTFSLLGLLSPDNRGSLTTAFILLFVFMGAFAGYHSSRTYKMFRGTEWKRATICTALFFPGTLFVVYFIMNMVLLAEGSSGAVSLGTFFTLLFLWFCVSVPLVFLGSFFGYKKEAPTHPVRTNQIPRLIPTQQWFMHPFITALLGGILPFGAVSVELFFIMSALWLHQIYYIFGFLFLVMIVLVVTCAEIAILLCYFQLCNEDYRWWWRSFLTAGSCAGYTFLYSVWYYITALDIESGVPTLIYFGYMSAISLTFFLITGTIGFYSCYWFNTAIYGSIKVD